MSLDVYLKMPGQLQPSAAKICIRENGATREMSREEWDAKFPGQEPVVAEMPESDVVYSRNITHNLNRMAGIVGLYEYLWRPEEKGITQAKQLIDPLTEGLRSLRQNEDMLQAYNPSNGWGNYENLVSFVESYLAACQEYPEAMVEVSR